MAAKFSIHWSDQAEKDLDKSYNFLLITWTSKEADRFLDLVFEFEETVLRHAEAFARSRKIKSCRMELVHRNVTAVYTIKDRQILVVALIDNRGKSRYK